MEILRRHTGARMIIHTELDVKHKELITIFMEANDLVGMVIREKPYEVRGRFHMTLELESTFEGTSQALACLGFKHAGVKNMLDDFLLKCGVGPTELRPASMHRQVQEEKEQEVTEEFMKQFKPKVAKAT